MELSTVVDDSISIVMFAISYPISVTSADRCASSSSVYASENTDSISFLSLSNDTYNEFHLLLRYTFSSGVTTLSLKIFAISSVCFLRSIVPRLYLSELSFILASRLSEPSVTNFLAVTILFA